MIGGMISSLVLTLLVIPAIYYLWKSSYPLRNPVHQPSNTGGVRMKYCKVVAIMNITDYNLLHVPIQQLGVPGVTVSMVKGFGARGQ